jgi:hypothetical protein
MKDYRASIEKLRKDSAEAALIRDLARDPVKRETFNRLHEHLKRLADEIERDLASAETAQAGGIETHERSVPEFD